jgi:hypothetical protein
VDKVAIGMHAVNVAKQISLSQQLYCYQFQIRRRPNPKNYFTVNKKRGICKMNKIKKSYSKVKQKGR